MPSITKTSYSDIFGCGKDANHAKASEHNTYVKVRASETKPRKSSSKASSKKPTKK